VVWRRRGTTYEASVARVLPYVLLPLLAVVGAVLLLLPATRTVGALLAIAGLGGLGLLALGLTVHGLREDAKYPGLRFEAFEIPRRWATLWGAFQGWRQFGWRGRGGSATGVGAPPSIDKR